MCTTLTLTILHLGGCASSKDSPSPTDTATPSETPTTDPTDNPTDSPTDPPPDLGGTEGEVQGLLMEFGEDYPGYSEAAERLLDAWTGGTPEGVTLSPPSKLRTGMVQVDTDLDGEFDEDWDVTLSQPGGDGTPIAVSARTGTYYDPSSIDVEVEMSTDGKIVEADEASISVFGEDVTMHGSSGAFEFGTGADSGESVGQMQFVAYTPNPDEEVASGELELVADGMGGYVLQARFEDSTLRSAPVSVPLSCQCYGDGCSQGPTPGSFLAVSAILGLIASRRRRR